MFCLMQTHIWRGVCIADVSCLTRFDICLIYADTIMKCPFPLFLDGGGAQWATDVTLCQNVSVFFPMPHCGCVCRISTLIMVPINFCEIFTCLKTKREQYFSSRIDRVLAFQRKSLKMLEENLSNTNHKSLKYFRSL